MIKNILVVIEQRDGKVKKSSLEAVSTASKLASETNSSVQAVILGGEIENCSSVAEYGISKINQFRNSDLQNYSPSAYTKIISEFANESGSDLIIIPNTSFGKDLAPRLAARLSAGCIMDIIHFEISSEELVCRRPIYAGKAMLDVKFLSDKKVLTLRPNVFKAEKLSGTSAEIILKEVTSPDLTTRVTEIKKSEGKLDVAEADIIVSGGRGVKGPENFHLIEELADTLGAAVGASRAVVDAGWRSHGEQVGQTGKTVSPSLYIACGISGAIQHLAGMSSSKYIVAINKDKDAPIFSVADYGIAGDLFEVLPKLTEEIKKMRT